MFQSFAAGQRTSASESSITKRKSESEFSRFAARIARRQWNQFGRLICSFSNELRFSFRPSNAALGVQLRHFFFERVEFVERASRGEGQRGACLARRPNIGEPVQRIFPRLQSKFITHRSRRRGLGATKPSSLIPDDGLNGRQQFRRRHHAHSHSRAPEYCLDDFAVAVPWNQNSIFNVVATDDPAGRDAQVEDRIAGGRQLMNHFSRHRPAVKNAGIALFENHHATALDALVAGIHRRRNKIRKADIGNETAALFHLKDGLFSRLPVDDSNLAVEHARIHTHIGDGFGQTECSPPGLAIFPGLRRSRKFHVVTLLLRSAPLMNGSQRQATSQTRRCSASIHPGQFKRNQRQHEILGTREQSTLFRIHEHRRDSRGIEGFEQLRFRISPLVRVSPAAGHQTRNRTARHLPGRLHQQLQIVAIRKSPQNLPPCIGRQCPQHLWKNGTRSRHRALLVGRKRFADSGARGGKGL